MKVLVTGAAGFIGYHVSAALLAQGAQVIGLDNFNPYYDVRLKEARAARLVQQEKFILQRCDIADANALDSVFRNYRPQRVVHLAAQAGVRHSLSHPQIYAQSNLIGFLNMLECCRDGQIEHLVYASTSSVYGANDVLPFSEAQAVAHPLSFYAASKAAGELMAHAYAATHGVAATGLRFFTVYGPWGRPDMALFLFTRAILNGEPIEIFNQGQMQRDFTYIDDIVQGILSVLPQMPQADPTRQNAARSPCAPHAVYNVGNMQPVALLDYIGFLEEKLGKKALKILRPMQIGDVPATASDCAALQALTGYQPRVSAREGVGHFVDWYLEYTSDA